MNIKAHFTHLLKNSGLTPERQNYWLHKLETGSFAEEDRVALINEMESHLATLNLKIFDKKNDLTSKREEFQQVQKQLEADLIKIEQQSAHIFQEDVEAYRNELFKVEGEALKAIETARREDEEAQIAHLRTQL